MKERVKLFLDRIDRQLCVRIPNRRLRIWWHQLWIRNDEFHPSLNMDTQGIVDLRTRKYNKRQAESEFEKYRTILNERRQIAHERTLD